MLWKLGEFETWGIIVSSLSINKSIRSKVARCLTLVIENYCANSRVLPYERLLVTNAFPHKRGKTTLAVALTVADNRTRDTWIRWTVRISSYRSSISKTVTRKESVPVPLRLRKFLEYRSLQERISLVRRKLLLERGGIVRCREDQSKKSIL